MGIIRFLRKLFLKNQKSDPELHARLSAARRARLRLAIHTAVARGIEQAAPSLPAELKKKIGENIKKELYRLFHLCSCP